MDITLKNKNKPEQTLNNVEKVEIEFLKNILRITHRPGQLLFYETEWDQVERFNFDRVEMKEEKEEEKKEENNK